ncbi:MAG TPA: sulfotransferase [Pseudonocardia sp.]|nr:sulfotransferase [Pseudonocardia sp.]
MSAPEILADHRTEWRPAPRPEWVQRVNEEGYCMDIDHVVPLDERSLLDSARDATGLDDFGADDWREPFGIFLKALKEEARLNLMGRLRTRSEILQLLCARLRIEDTYKRHPEIADETITQPLIIVGQGRSGTTLLQNLLDAHPDNCAPKHWEMVFPAPPPEAATYHSDPRIEAAHKLVDQWNRVTPEFASMHEFAGAIPMEDNVTMAMNFMAPTWMDCMGQVPSYDQYIFAQPFAPALRWLERVLKLLQWRNPREHWVLKDPMHLDRMPELLKIWPDACFIWPHRDPVRALASLVSTVGTIQWGRSDHPFSAVSLAYMTDPYLAAGRFDAVAQGLAEGSVPEGQIFHVLFRDLVADPVGQADAMYRHFGIGMTEQGRAALAAFMRDNPRDNRPPHQFPAGSPDVVARARDAFKSYQERFGVPNE